jgi:hypothetical protein
MNKKSIFGNVIIIALGGFLFGYDIAMISGTTAQLEALFDLSKFWLGFTVAVAIIGIIIGTRGKKGAVIYDQGLVVEHPGFFCKNNRFRWFRGCIPGWFYTLPYRRKRFTGDCQLCLCLRRVCSYKTGGYTKLPI